MDLLEKFVDKIMDSIKLHFPVYSDETLAEIEYGLTVLIANSFKPIIIFIIAYFLHILTLVIFTLFVFAMLRLYSGGRHLNSSFICTIASIGMFLSIAFLAKYLIIDISFLIFINLALGLPIIYHYIPVETINRPIRSKKQRKQFKRNFCFIYTIAIISSLLLPYIYAKAILLTALCVFILCII